MNHPFRQIGYLGAGQLASGLSHVLSAAGSPPAWIWSRTEIRSAALASRFGVTACSGFESPLPPCDLVLVCLADDSVSGVLEKVNFASPGTPVVHTSGSVPMNAIPLRFNKRGVFYPLQTFSHDRKPEVQGIPLCIEASDDELYGHLEALARSIGTQPVNAGSHQRLQLHVAAVFACNYTNYMYTLAQEMLRAAGLPFSLLHPLIRETAKKATEIPPDQAQTGPAMRGDTGVLKRHLELLKNNGKMYEVYEMLSRMLGSNHTKQDGKL